MAFYVKKKKNYAVKPDEVDIFVNELKRAQAKTKKPKTAIYRKDRAPDWAEEDQESSDDESKLVVHQRGERGSRDIRGSRRRVEATVLERQIRTAEILVEGDDITLSSSSSSAQAKKKPPPVEQVFDVSALEVPDAEDSEDSSDDEGADARRARARQRAKQRGKEQEEELPIEDDQKEEEEDESSEYETDSEDEVVPSRMLLKPVFVSRKERETIKERERLKQEQLAMEEAKRLRLIERKKESRRMVVDELAREEEAKRKGNDSDAEMPSDDDGDDEEDQLRQWKIRELRRIKRDQDEREKWEQQEIDTERRRHMTDEELKAEDDAKGLNQPKDKGNYRFLQKYYHRGSFFTDTLDAEYKAMDYAAPTGADRTIDRTLLPQVLQVKKFGLKGRTKYTHLVDQDTTRKDVNPWAAAEATGMGVGPRGRKIAGTGDVYTKKRRLN